MAGATVLLTLPLGVLLGSWLGARLGARATLRLLFPFPTIVYHLGVATEQGLAAASAQAAASLGTVPMVFAWAIPFSWASRRVRSPFVAFALATAVSFAVDRWAPPVSPLVALAITVAAVPLLRADGDAPVPLPPANLAGRLLSIVGLLTLLGVLGKRGDPVSVALLAVLSAFPRMTVELTVGTWLAAGPDAARQVLSGLPLGLFAALVWCGGLTYLPHTPWALAISFAGTCAVTGGLAWTHRSGSSPLSPP
jgi:hypothetical protein